MKFDLTTIENLLCKFETSKTSQLIFIFKKKERKIENTTHSEKWHFDKCFAVLICPQTWCYTVDSTASCRATWPFDTPVRSSNIPKCLWRQRGNVKNSLGLNPGQGARERKRRKEQEKVEEEWGGREGGQTL